MSRLKNKVAVITAGNSGLGFGIAREFKNEGAFYVNNVTFFAAYVTANAIKACTFISQILNKSGIL